jgi:Na+/melibiose symporter-like transporter
LVLVAIVSSLLVFSICFFSVREKKKKKRKKKKREKREKEKEGISRGSVALWGFGTTFSLLDAISTSVPSCTLLRRLQAS